VLNLQQDKTVKLETEHSATVLSLAQSGSGRWMASGCAGGRILLRDLSGACPRLLVAEIDRPVMGLALDHEGHYLACLTPNGAVRRFDLPAPLPGDADELAQRVNAAFGSTRAADSSELVVQTSGSGATSDAP
jgi:WD40 repeat protein